MSMLASVARSRGFCLCKCLIPAFHKRKKSGFFITSPIFYVNASPHIGHVYTAVIADATHRFQRLLGRTDTLFSTGTDEHGMKIQQAAAERNSDLPTYCNSVSKEFHTLFKQCDIEFTDFIRTTEERHKKAVKQFWTTLQESGFLYSSEYSGYYSIPDETFVPESLVKEQTGKDGKVIMVSTDSGHPVEWTVEKNYMFKLSNFQEDLLHWLKKDVVKPAKFQKSLMKWVLDGLEDLSVSRPAQRLHWGVPVPDDPDQTIYVWLDALVNYLTVSGYPHENCNWPVDVHVIGKDILKFHGVYWPAFLIAANLEPPSKILCHSHWTVDGEKMSKSKGNVVDPFELMDTYGSNGLRYFLLREGVLHSDGNYSDTKMIRIVNTELADTLGNLLSRCCSPKLNTAQVFPEFSEECFQRSCRGEGEKLVSTVTELPNMVKVYYSDCNFHKGIDAIISTLHQANRFMEGQKPWELKKQAKDEQLGTVLHITMETLRVCGIMLQPVVPEVANILLGKLNILKNKRNWLDLKSFSWEKAKPGTRLINNKQVMLYKRIQAR